MTTQILQNGTTCPEGSTFRLEFDAWKLADGTLTSHIEGYNVYDYIDIDEEYDSEHAALAAMKAVKPDCDGVRPELSIRVIE